MTRAGRFVFLVFFAGFLACLPHKTAAQQPTSTAPPPQNPPPQNLPEEGLPEEDADVKPRTYAFDPLEAERNIRVGNFYMHKGTASGYRAAAGRYQDATRYNPSSPEAFLRLGEAEEKLKHTDAAKNAFARVLQLAPDSKFAREAKKKLNRKT